MPCLYGVMTQHTIRAEIDPVVEALMAAVPLEFTVDDGVEVARERLRAIRPRPAKLPQMRIEERIAGHGDIDDIPVT